MIAELGPLRPFSAGGLDVGLERGDCLFGGLGSDPLVADLVVQLGQLDQEILDPGREGSDLSVLSGEVGDLFGEAVPFASRRDELGVQCVDALLVGGGASLQRRTRLAPFTLGDLVGRLRPPSFALGDGTALFGGTPPLGVLLAELSLILQSALEASGLAFVRGDLTLKLAELRSGLVSSDAFCLSAGSSHELVVLSVEPVQLASGVFELLCRGLPACGCLICEAVLVEGDGAGLGSLGDVGSYQMFEAGHASLASGRLEGVEPRRALGELDWPRAFGWSGLEEHVIGRVRIGVIAQLEGWMGVLVLAKH